MVSLPYPLMYSQEHPSNLAYPTSAPAWYPNYSSCNTHHASHHPNNQFYSLDDSYNLSTPSSQFYANGMTPPTSLHLSPTMSSHHNSSANGQNMQNGLQNIPPSPPITVNSACSEISSPGIGSNGGVGSGDTSPSMNPNNNNLSRPKSPYEWMKKPSYQSQPTTGMY